MKKIFCQQVEAGRHKKGMYASHEGADFGKFELFFKGRTLRVIASSGYDAIPWDHVSVSLENRCPNWEEMCWIKDLFFEDDETVIQYHPAKKDYVNFHPYCLHLWRPINCDFPKPPPILVGPK